MWEPSRVLELIDSVLNGWPIGSLLLLEGPQPFQVRQLERAPEVVDESVRYYLLDGQQRVTSLYLALAGRSDVHYFLDLEDFDEDSRPSLKWSRRAPNQERRTIPLEAVLDPQAFLSVVESLGAEAEEWLQDARDGLEGGKRDRLYRVPAIVMEHGISLEALTRIFETLNRTGLRLSAFDLMVAVLYPSGFHLRDRWTAALENEPILEDFETESIELLKLIALWQRDIDNETRARPPSRRVKGVRQRDVLATPAKTVIGEWDHAVKAYADALRYLRSQARVTPSALPAETMVLTLAYLLDRQVKSGLIERWYWRSIARQTYAQGANTRVLSDIRDPGSAETRGDTLAIFDLTLDDQLRRNGILRRGLQGLAQRNGARDLITGEPLSGELVEVSLSDPRHTPIDGQTALIDIVWLNVPNDHDHEIWDRLVTGTFLTPEQEAAFESQGIPRGPMDRDDVRDARKRHFREWMSEVL